MKRSERDYEDMLDMPHHVSSTRPRMSVQDRAAQFAPFKTMVGLDDEVTEVARITDEKLEISEEEAETINQALQEIAENISSHPKVKILYFCPDRKKAGGEYRSYEGNVKRINEAQEKLIFIDGTTVNINDLYEVNIKEE
jgi:hypothetical protein